MAFFPCVRFEDQIIMSFRGENYAQRNHTDIQKLQYCMKIQTELTELYIRLSKLCIICIEKKIPLIIENPYSTQHYLTQRWCIRPAIIDRDRRENGDYYKKPTQYFFIGCRPENNLVFEPLEYVETMNIERQIKRDGKNRTVMRSMIHPQYARRFIKAYILDADQTDEETTKQNIHIR